MLSYHIPGADVREGDLVVFNDHYEGRVRLPACPGRIQWVGNHTYGIDFGEDQIRIVKKEYVRKCGQDIIGRMSKFNAERSYDAMVV